MFFFFLIPSAFYARMTKIFTISCSCNITEAFGKQEVTASGILDRRKVLKILISLLVMSCETLLTFSS